MSTAKRITVKQFLQEVENCLIRYDIDRSHISGHIYLKSARLVPGEHNAVYFTRSNAAKWIVADLKLRDVSSIDVLRSTKDGKAYLLRCGDDGEEHTIVTYTSQNQLWYDDVLPGAEINRVGNRGEDAP